MEAAAKNAAAEMRTVRYPRPAIKAFSGFSATATSVPVAISRPISPSRIPIRNRYAGRKMKITE